MENSKSVKKYIRTQKALIRRQFFDTKKQNEMIDAMYRKISGTQNAEEKTAEALVLKEKQNAKKPKVKDKKPKVKVKDKKEKSKA